MPLILRIGGVLGSSEEKKEIDVDNTLVATLPKNPVFRI